MTGKGSKSTLMSQDGLSRGVRTSVRRSGFGRHPRGRWCAVQTRAPLTRPVASIDQAARHRLAKVIGTSPEDEPCLALVGRAVIDDCPPLGSVRVDIVDEQGHGCHRPRAEGIGIGAPRDDGTHVDGRVYDHRETRNSLIGAPLDVPVAKTRGEPLGTRPRWKRALNRHLRRLVAGRCRGVSTAYPRTKTQQHTRHHHSSKGSLSPLHCHPHSFVHSHVSQTRGRNNRGRQDQAFNGAIATQETAVTVGKLLDVMVKQQEGIAQMDESIHVLAAIAIIEEEKSTALGQAHAGAGRVGITVALAVVAVASILVAVFT